MPWLLFRNCYSRNWHFYLPISPSFWQDSEFINFFCGSSHGTIPVRVVQNYTQKTTGQSVSFKKLTDAWQHHFSIHSSAPYNAQKSLSIIPCEDADTMTGRLQRLPTARLHRTIIDSLCPARKTKKLVSSVTKGEGTEAHLPGRSRWERVYLPST